MVTQYLISAHHEHAHLRRLCKVLAMVDPTARLTVVHDVGKPLPAPGLLAPSVEVVGSRRPVHWGDHTFLDELIHAMRRLLAEPWDHLVAITGQDYPIKPPRAMVHHLEAGGLRGFLWSDPVAAPTDHRNPTELQLRYFYRHWWLPPVLWRLAGGDLWARRAVRAVAALPLPCAVYARSRPRGESLGIGVRARRTPFGPERPCRYGSDQFALERSLVEALVRSADMERHVLAYFRRTSIPTESWLHTVLWPWGEELEQEVRLHHSRFDGTAHPRTLTTDDFADIAVCPSFFARKLDASSSGLLDRIDTELLGLATPVR